MADRQRHPRLIRLPRLARHRYRLAAGFAALAAACALPALTLAGPAPRAAAAPVHSTGVKTDVASLCPDLHAVYPGDARGSNFYGVPTAVQINNGTFNIGSEIQTKGINATVCAFFVFPQVATRSNATPINDPGQPDDCPGCSITFKTGTSVSIYDTVVLPATLAVTGPVTATISPVPDPRTGGLEINFTTPVTATVNVPEVGVACSLTVSATLTTGTSGQLTGAPITGSLATGASAAGVGATFTVPAATPSTDCPADLVPGLNALTGLPAPPGAATFQAPLTLFNSLT